MKKYEIKCEKIFEFINRKCHYGHDISFIEREFIDDAPFSSKFLFDNKDTYFESTRRMALTILFNKFLTAKRKWKPIC